MKGTIKRLTDKNFGFIALEEGDKDVFFHASELQGIDFASLQVGDIVEFEVQQSDKGPKAVAVHKV